MKGGWHRRVWGPRQSRRLCWGEDEQGNAARDAHAWASQVEWTLRGRDWGIPKMAFVRIPRHFVALLPTPFVPAGHFPLIGGIGPLARGAFGPVRTPAPTEGIVRWRHHRRGGCPHPPDVWRRAGVVAPYERPQTLRTVGAACGRPESLPRGEGAPARTQGRMRGRWLG